MIIKIVILVGLLRLLVWTNKPFFCAGLYTAVYLILGLLGKATVPAVLIGTVIVFLLSGLYFWLLERFGENTGAFIAIAVMGIFIGLV